MDAKEFKRLENEMILSIVIFRALGEDGMETDQSDAHMASWLIGDGWTKK